MRLRKAYLVLATLMIAAMFLAGCGAPTADTGGGVAA
jgi:predicted small secreted protein